MESSNLAKQHLIQSLIKRQVLTTPQIIAAFQQIDRADFVTDSHKHEAYQDHPLPIGQGQTISQPYTVAFMLELLQPEPGHNILDIGSGSGWQTALLAHIVGPQGHVLGLERISELADQSIKNLSRYNFIDQGTVEIRSTNAQAGAPDQAPFDKIIAAAEVQDIPQPWLDQLKIGGRLVTPQHSSLVVIEKKSDKDFIQKTIPGFAFVPFIAD